MREELGGTYSIRVNADNSRLLPDPEYQASIVFGSDPSRVEELLEEVMQEVDWLRAGGEQKYLDTVKELLRTSRQEQLRDNGFWLSQIRAAVQRAESFTEIVSFEEWLGGVDSGAGRGRSSALLHRRPLRACSVTPGGGLAPEGSVSLVRPA